MHCSKNQKAELTKTSVHTKGKKTHKIQYMKSNEARNILWSVEEVNEKKCCLSSESTLCAVSEHGVCARSVSCTHAWNIGVWHSRLWSDGDVDHLRFYGATRPSKCRENQEPVSNSFLAALRIVENCVFIYVYYVYYIQIWIQTPIGTVGGGTHQSISNHHGISSRRLQKEGKQKKKKNRRRRQEEEEIMWYWNHIRAYFCMIMRGRLCSKAIGGTL